MHYIFFILSITLFCYSYEEPHCAVGGIIFAVLGALLLNEAARQNLKERESKGLKRKRK